MLSVRSRLSSVISRRTFATVAAETAKAQPDQKFKVVVVGGGPGGLSGILIVELNVHKITCFTHIDTS